MPELMAVVDASREKESRHHKFLAAIQGIDLDKNKSKKNGSSTNSSESKDPFETVKAKALARINKMSEEQARAAGEMAANAKMGIDYAIMD